MYNRTESPLHSISPHQYTLLMERAKRDAMRLRREAITAFWADVARAVRSALKRGRTDVFATAHRTAPLPR